MKKLFVFISGAILGSAITYRVMKSHYEPEYEDDFEDDLPEEIDEPDPKETLKQIVDENGYTQYTTKEDRKEAEEDMDKPYVISPEEFSDSEYNTESLTYWDDGVVTNDEDIMLSDDEIEELIGKDSLNHFGEYEDDSVFVRNDRLRTDYEILADSRPYGEVE